MENLSQLISIALKQETSGHSTSTPTFEHSKAVNYFFAWMKMTYPSDYSFNVAPTDRREDMIKASSAEYLDGYNRTQIDNGIKFIREMKQSAEGKYHRLDVDLCIGAIREANRSTSAHKALPAPEGRKMSNDDAMAQLAAIRGDIGGPPTPAPKPEITGGISKELEYMKKTTRRKR